MDSGLLTHNINKRSFASTKALDNRLAFFCVDFLVCHKFSSSGAFDLLWGESSRYCFPEASFPCHATSLLHMTVCKSYEKESTINLTLLHWQVKSSEWLPAKDTFFFVHKKNNSRIREYIKSGKWMNNFIISTS